MYQDTYNLFPEIEPYRKDSLRAEHSHQIYFEECGNPNGAPVVFLHGGPGSGCNPMQRRFFDPNDYRVILFDQRGCGRSTPLGCTEANSTDDLIRDIEALREHLGIAKWHVFGGSWGSTLALAYALQHANRIISLALRGIFLSRPQELDWFLGDVKAFFPEIWQRLLEYLPENERDNVLSAYEKRVFSDDLSVCEPAAIHWNAYESSIMRLKPSETTSEAALSATERQVEVARARVQIHYIRHRCFVDGESMLKNTHKIAHIPTIIVQGRYDMVCPPQTAWALAQAMPHAKLIMVPDAGHSAAEPGITSALVATTEQFKAL